MSDNDDMSAPDGVDPAVAGTPRPATPAADAPRPADAVAGTGSPGPAPAVAGPDTPRPADTGDTSRLWAPAGGTPTAGPQPTAGPHQEVPAGPAPVPGGRPVSPYPPAVGYPPPGGVAVPAGYPPPGTGQTHEFARPQFGPPGGWPPAGAHPAGPPYPQRPRRGGPARVAGVAVLALVLAGGGGVVGGLVVHASDRSAAPTTATAAARPVVLDRTSLASLVASVKPSVVAVSTSDAEGSGVVLTADGYILTNNHVVADATGNTVDVSFAGANTAQATIVGTDPKTDLAVVKASGVAGLVTAKFGDSDSLQVGDQVIAIGSPLGLEGSVTAGIVSALNRTIDESTQSGGSGATIAGAIQTDAAINPGNSGGALVDMAGEVVGINTAIATSGNSQGNIGVGFAIPGNKANAVAQALIKGQKVSHPYIGVHIGTETGNTGAKISRVDGGSPAEKAGLQVGDLIVKAGNTDIHTSDDLLNVVQAGKVGDRLQLTIERGGGQRTLTLTLGESPN